MLNYFRDFKVLRETRKEFWGIQIINFLDCTIFFAMIAIASIFLSDDFGFSDEDAGYIITVFTSATTIALFFSGMITDWLGIKVSLYVAMGGMLVTRSGIAILGLMDDIPYRGILVGILFFLMAPFMSMIATVFQAANRRFTTKNSRSAGFNIWYMVMNVGAMVGGLLLDVIRVSLELPNAHVFTVGALFSVLCTVVTFLMIHNVEQNYADDEERPKTVEEGGEAPKKKNPFQIAREVLADSTFWRLVVIIMLLLGVRSVFYYMYLLMPKYWVRLIGPDALVGTLNAINPFLIVFGVFLFIPFANKFNIFKMLVYGAMISAFSLFFLGLPWQWFGSDMAFSHYAMSIAALVVLSIGEVIWSPKLSEYTAAVAPEGQEGSYMGLTMVPNFLSKMLISLASGHMLAYWVPEGVGEAVKNGTIGYWQSPAGMWTILGLFALSGPILCLVIKGWLTKGARWKTGDEPDAKPVEEPA